MLALACFAAAAQAQTYPDRPIRLIAPFPAGGLADVLARAVGDEMTKSLGQPVIVENRAGAGGNTGADAVAKAAPDGYTLLMSSAGILTANPFLYAKMPFDVGDRVHPGLQRRRDVDAAGGAIRRSRRKTLKEFVALAKAQPGKLNFGSPGIGTTGHLGLAMFMHAAERADHPRALSRRRAGGARSDRRPDRRRGRQSADGDLAHPGRQAAPAGGRGEAAHGAAARRADRGRGGRRQLRGVVLVRHRGAGRHAARRSSRGCTRRSRRRCARRRCRSASPRSGARLVGDTPEDFAAQIRAERAHWGEIIKAANIKPE